MDALQEVADDWVKNLSSDSRTFVLTDHLAQQSVTSGLQKTIEVTFNASAQVCRVVKKNRTSTGETKEIIVFPLDQYLDPNTQRFKQGSQEEQLISSFTKNFQIDVKTLKNLAMSEYSLPNGGLLLKLDLDQPRVAQIFMMTPKGDQLLDGTERTIEVFQFNRSGQIVAHSREVVIYDTESKCEIFPLIRATRSNSHIVIPLVRNHIYSHPQYQTVDFVFLDLTRMALEPFRLKVNVQRDSEWTYDIAQKIHESDLTYLFVLQGFYLKLYSILSGTYFRS